MRKVLKYEITTTPQTLKLPPDCKILKVDRIGGKTLLWIEGEANPGLPPVERTFSVFAPGQPIHNDEAVYLGTATFEKEAWHVYEDVNLAKVVETPAAGATPEVKKSSKK